MRPLPSDQLIQQLKLGDFNLACFITAICNTCTYFPTVICCYGQVADIIVKDYFFYYYVSLNVRGILILGLSKYITYCKP